MEGVGGLVFVEEVVIENVLLGAIEQVADGARHLLYN